MKGNLNNAQTFKTYICKEQNAYKAAKTLVGNPHGLSLLYIHGDRGVGKTHLLNAIGNEVIEQNLFSSVIFSNAEMFTNELIIALRNNELPCVREKYNNADYLLFDDLHELSNKEYVQVELMSIIKVLVDNNKTIAFGSNVSCDELTNINDEIKSFISLGTSVKIENYDFMDKKDILLSELDKIGLEKKQYIFIKESIIPKIAETEVSDVRELFGCLNRLIFFMEMIGEDLNENDFKKIIALEKKK